MTTKTTSSRADTIRKRRTTSKTAPAQPARRTSRPATRQAFRAQTTYLPGDLHRSAPKPLQPGPAKKQTQGRFTQSMGTVRGSRSRAERKAFDFSFSLGRTDVRAPVLAIPHLGPRWVSGIMSLLLVFMLYTMWTASTFTVSAAEVSGNSRLTPEDIYGGLGLAGQPIFKTVPAQIQNRLRTAFPDLSSVAVQVRFPNHVAVQIVERQPILQWYQDGKTTWIDASGVAFMPRGQVDGLVQVASDGSPTGILPDPNKPFYDQVFIQPEMVKAIVALSPYVPVGVSMTYDPQYGMGWQDPRGWDVYFGQSIQDIQMKLQVYKSMVDTFTRQGIQPTMISVEYLDAPFYK